MMNDHSNRGVSFKERGMREIGPYLLPISAIISVFCFPPFPFGALIFVALVPFLLAIENIGPARAFKYGFLWGLIFYFGLVYYIAWVTIPGMIATVLILSLIPATAGWFFVKLLARSKGTALVFLPSYFIMWYWLFTKSDLNYPWTDIGYALSYYTTMIQAAEIGGVYLISLLIFAVNILIYASVSDNFSISGSLRRNLRVISILLILSLYVYGSIRLWDTADGNVDDELTVGILQGNITRDVKWKPGNVQKSFDKYFQLSKEVAGYAPDLIIWPETAIPEYMMQRAGYKKMMRAFVDSLDIPVLTGTPYYEVVGPDEYIFFNTAAFLKPKIDDNQVYFKIHLVPVSERIPFRGKFKILREIRLGQADWSQGEEMTIFELNGYKFATVICFESVFPGFCREFAQRGAQFLVVITNDMWFGRTSLLEQHAMMSVFRAIENRIPVVRSANTGISMAIDKWGRIAAKSGIFVEDYLVADIKPETSDSVYGSVGDVIPRALTILSLMSIAVALWGRRRYNTEEL
jgi:apolipoprotein N-acyltransferase